MKTPNITVLAISLLFASLASAGAAIVTVPVPETGATVGLFAVGLVAVAALRRKLRK